MNNLTLDRHIRGLKLSTSLRTAKAETIMLCTAITVWRGSGSETRDGKRQNLCENSQGFSIQIVAQPSGTNLQLAAETCEFLQVPPLSMSDHGTLKCTLTSLL